MNIDRQLKVRDQAAGSVNSLYRSLDYLHLTSSQINERFLKIKELLPNRTPRHIRSFLDGMRSVHNSLLFHEKLEFCYTVTGKTVDKDGLTHTFKDCLVSTHKDTGRYYEDQGIQPSELQKLSSASGFYYKGTDFPHFVSPKE